MPNQIVPQGDLQCSQKQHPHSRSLHQPYICNHRFWRFVERPHNSQLQKFRIHHSSVVNRAFIKKETTYPLFVTIHFIPAALAAARPMALSSTTTHLQNTENVIFFFFNTYIAPTKNVAIMKLWLNEFVGQWIHILISRLHLACNLFET